MKAQQVLADHIGMMDGWLSLTYIKGWAKKKKKNEYHSVIVIFKFNSFICL